MRIAFFQPYSSLFHRATGASRSTMKNCANFTSFASLIHDTHDTLIPMNFTHVPRHWLRQQFCQRIFRRPGRKIDRESGKVMRGDLSRTRVSCGSSSPWLVVLVVVVVVVVVVSTFPDCIDEHSRRREPAVYPTLSIGKHCDVSE